MDLSTKIPNGSISDTISSSDVGTESVGKKRKKLSTDERLNRNRERNRIHARKTRERKKYQTAAIHQRIQDLYYEGMRLRQLIDEQYTASSLLGLSQAPKPKLTIESQDGMEVAQSDEPLLQPSSSICENYYEKILNEISWIKDPNGNPYIQAPSSTKRVRRTGKLNPQEREKIRRERNRMHAKKTRDRKKFFMEMSEKIITEMESESLALRRYLTQIGLMSEEEYETYVQRDLLRKQELAEAKRNGLMESGEEGEEEEEEEEEDDEEGEDDGETASEAEGAETTERGGGDSDENEKTSSWSRSSHSSSNHGSSGSGSGTGQSSSNTGETSSSKLSNATGTTNESLQGKQSGDGSSGSGERGSPENEWNEGDEYRLKEEPPSDRNSQEPQAPESYHHGRKGKGVTGNGTTISTNY